VHVVVCALVPLFVCMPTCYASQPRRPAAAARNPGVDNANPFVGRPVLVPRACAHTPEFNYIKVPLGWRGILKYNYTHC